MENIDFSDMYDPKEKEVRNCHINVGSGKEVSIAQLAGMIKDIIGYEGSLVFNTDKQDEKAHRCFPPGRSWVES